jgi:hypothetical protein
MVINMQVSCRQAAELMLVRCKSSRRGRVDFWDCPALAEP